MRSVPADLARAATAAALLGSLGGCFLFGSSSTGPKMAGVPAITPTVQLRTLWSTNVGRSGESVLTPAGDAGSVFAAARDGTVTKLDAASGRVLWRASVGQTVSGGVGAGSDVVTVGTNEGEVIALDASDGSVRWRARVSSEVLAAPAVSGDVVVVRCSDSRVFALDVKDGRRRWVYQRAMPTLTVRSPAGAVVRAQTVYAGFAGGRLAALALANGGVRWEAAVALPRGSTELERVADVVGLPWVSEREACAVAYQGRVACFDAASGQPIWSRDVSSVAGLGVDARYVFVSDDRGAVHALDRSNGTSFWKNDQLFLRKLTAPLPLGKEVAVGDVQGYVHLMSRDSGELVGRTATDGSDIVAAPVAIPGGFLVQTRGGNLYAFALPGS